MVLCMLLSRADVRYRWEWLLRELRGAAPFWEWAAKWKARLEEFIKEDDFDLGPLVYMLRQIVKEARDMGLFQES